MNIIWFSIYILFIIVFAPLFVKYLNKRKERNDTAIRSNQ